MNWLELTNRGFCNMFRHNERATRAEALIVGYAICLPIMALFYWITVPAAVETAIILAVAFPGWSVGVRRLNDTEAPRTYFNLFFATCLSGTLLALYGDTFRDDVSSMLVFPLAIVALYCGFRTRAALFAPSQPGPNKYGPNPTEVTP